ncbi:MAG: F0F1 ATP synthase subunit delta [Gammaproteobacteria bacterium]
MAGNRTLARPYAVAAFAHAKEKGVVETWSTQLTTLALVVADATTRALIANPKISEQQLEQLLIEVCGDTDEGFKNFIRVLVGNDRVGVAPEIAEEFEASRAQDDARIEVRVTSAYKLAADHQTAISDAMKAKFGRDVNVTAEIDRDLMAGVIIRAGDTVIDASLRGRLNQLALDLAG